MERDKARVAAVINESFAQEIFIMSEYSLAVKSLPKSAFFLSYHYKNV